jgi:hypothetical protein
MPAVLRSLLVVAAASVLMLAVGHLVHHYLLAGDAYSRIILF